MKSISIWIALACSAIFGLTGYVLGARAHDNPRETAPATDVAKPTFKASPAAGAAANDRRATVAPPAAGNCADTGTLQAENTELRQRIDRLRQAVDAERSMRVQTEGSAIAFPAGLDEKYTGPKLAEAIEDSLAELSLDGAVNAMDCSEFPCIAHGELAAKEGIDVALQELTRLHEEAAKRYPDAQFYVSHTAWTGADGEPVLLFSMTYYEPPASDAAALERRMRHRKNQFIDAFTGK